MSIAMGFPSTPAGSQGGSTFSPLTMFECTISSATMLIDSMAVRDLLMAFKIVAQLHGHLLEVLDPTVQRLANVADEHSQCPPPASRSVGNSSGGLAAVAAAAAAAAAAGAPGTSKLGKPEPNSFSTVKSEPCADSDDDCVLMEADLVFDASNTSTTAFGQSPPAKVPRLGVGGSGGADLTDSGELSNEWKASLRKAYRVLKDETGTNVFDFSLPYSARVNVLAANRVIDRALSLSSQQPANLAAWRKVCTGYVSNYFSWTLKPSAKKLIEQAQLHQRMDRFKNLCSKLNRRQKSYEAIKASLDAATQAKFESVLNRDYTSSDEEGGADLDSEMKVRSLPWESLELKAMKRRLDDVFIERLADDKQRADVTRLQRDPAVLSSRPPPADQLDWARDPAWIALAQPAPTGGME